MLDSLWDRVLRPILRPLILPPGPSERRVLLLALRVAEDRTAAAEAALAELRDDRARILAEIAILRARLAEGTDPDGGGRE